MPLSQLFPAKARSRCITLALIFTFASSAPCLGKFCDRNNRCDINIVEGDFFKPIADMFSNIAHAFETSQFEGIAIGPEIVAGEATCPRSAEGEGVDCATAALAVCARAGFQDGFQMSTTTRRVCRGSAIITGVGAEGADCRPKTSTTRALCW